MRSFAGPSLLIVSLVGAGSVSAGLPQQGRTVPEELLRALVGAEAELLIGELPADLAATLSLPDDARVIGAVVRSERTMSTTYVALPGDPEQSFEFFRQQLLDAGWRSPPQRGQPRGFQPPVAETFGDMFCAPDGEHLSVFIRDGADDPVAHLTHYTTYPGISPCDRATRPQSRSNDLQERMPTLNVAAEELARRGGTGTAMAAGRDSAWTSVELRSERATSQIAADFAAQLEAEGWAPTFRSGSEQASLTGWSRTFDDGFLAIGSLVVIELSEGRIEAIFRLRTLPEQ